MFELFSAETLILTTIEIESLYLLIAISSIAISFDFLFVYDYLYLNMHIKQYGNCKQKKIIFHKKII